MYGTPLAPENLGFGVSGFKQAPRSNLGFRVLVFGFHLSGFKQDPRSNLGFRVQTPLGFRVWVPLGFRVWSPTRVSG